ncbi:MAG TPA: hypothetical protein VG321_03520 [Solirubrobacteraceae bacterium]|nr:hypothetical protein [Solirubrobacteraceae bacterium]
MRAPGATPDDPAAHVLVLATLAAQPRRGRLSKGRRDAPTEPGPTPVSTGRATVISVASPLADQAAARRWLADAGEGELTAHLGVLNRALHAFGLITADPHLPEVSRGHLLVARVGYGVGDEVAHGRWSEARELLPARTSRRRAKVLEPQARLAAVLGGRDKLLACETLAHRAQADLDAGRDREAALQLWVALDATLAELGADPAAGMLAERLAELSAQRDAVADAAQAALSGELGAEQLAEVELALGRVQAALRARALGSA